MWRAFGGMFPTRHKNIKNLATMTAWGFHLYISWDRVLLLYPFGKSSPRLTEQQLSEEHCLPAEDSTPKNLLYST